MTGNTNNNKELSELYERYASLVYRRCRFILHSDDDAWDATQEVFIKLMASLSTIQNRAAVYSWLLSTSTNLCISMLRRKKGEEFDETFHSFEGQKSEMSAEKRLLFKEIISTLLRPWDKKVRDVLIYSYIDEYSQKEISELMGIGESTIRKYLTRFKRGVRYAYSDAKEVIDA
jgi:RNA polymerase sigma factor (sigma-70 family)